MPFGGNKKRTINSGRRDILGRLIWLKNDGSERTIENRAMGDQVQIANEYTMVTNQAATALMKGDKELYEKKIQEAAQIFSVYKEWGYLYNSTAESRGKDKQRWADNYTKFCDMYGIGGDHQSMYGDYLSTRKIDNTEFNYQMDSVDDIIADAQAMSGNTHQSTQREQQDYRDVINGDASVDDIFKNSTTKNSSTSKTFDDVMRIGNITNIMKTKGAMTPKNFATMFRLDKETALSFIDTMEFCGLLRKTEDGKYEYSGGIGKGRLTRAMVLVVADRIYQGDIPDEKRVSHGEIADFIGYSQEVNSMTTPMTMDGIRSHLKYQGSDQSLKKLVEDMENTGVISRDKETGKYVSTKKSMGSTAEGIVSLAEKFVHTRTSGKRFNFHDKGNSSRKGSSGNQSSQRTGASSGGAGNGGRGGSGGGRATAGNSANGNGGNGRRTTRRTMPEEFYDNGSQRNSRQQTRGRGSEGSYRREPQSGGDFGSRTYDTLSRVFKNMERKSGTSRYGSFRVTARPRIGPFVFNMGKGGVASTSLDLGIFRYRIWSKDQENGVSSIDLPSGLSFRPKSRKKAKR